MLKDKLKELRLKANMTQAEVAENLGVSIQTVSPQSPVYLYQL